MPFKRYKFRFLRHCLAIGLACIFGWPIFWLILGSLWPDKQPLSIIWTRPEAFVPTLINFSTASQMVPLGQFSLNSFRVILIAVPLTTLIASWAGFALVRLPKSIQLMVLWVSMGALLAPPTAIWLARFPIFKALGWIDTPWPLIAPALIGGTPFFVLLYYWAFRRVPLDLFAAAILAGASPWQLWQYIALPIARNTTLSIIVLSTVLFWRNFPDPLLYLRSQAQMTLPMGVRFLAQLDMTRWSVMLAGAVVLTLPVILVFIASYWLSDTTNSFLSS